jgi:hypothetical protein
MTKVTPASQLASTMTQGRLRYFRRNHDTWDEGSGGLLLLVNYHEAAQQFATTVIKGESKRFVIQPYVMSSL